MWRERVLVFTTYVMPWSLAKKAKTLFYLVFGVHIIVNSLQTELHIFPSSSIKAPRRVKHTWSSVGNSWVVALKKIKHAPIKWLTHSTPRYLSNRNESVCPYKDLYMKVHGSFIYKSQNLEITHMFINSRLCKPSNYTMKKYSTIKRNGILIQ